MVLSRGTWILYKKEVKDYFNSSTVYILAGLFIFISGWLFFNYLMASKEPTTLSLTASVLIPTFGNINLIFLFFAPLITMRIFAEERKQKTLELLYLSKLSDNQIILSKLMASFTVAIFLIGLTVIFPIILLLSGYKDFGVICTSYLGLTLCVFCYLTVGIFTSSLTQNQIIAAILSFTLLLGFVLMILSVNTSELSMTKDILKYMSVPFHLEGFVLGSMKSFSFVYFASFFGFFFYLTKKSLDVRHW
jgi:ABC-2 type transport system permease protein